MGHYRSEMICNTCDQHPCICPQKPAPVLWLIDDDFSPITTIDFDKKYGTRQTKYGPVSALPLFKRVGKPTFATREEALLAIPEKLAEEIAAIDRHVKSLKLSMKKYQLKLKHLQAKV